jgi:hypothetical protein
MQPHYVTESQHDIYMSTNYNEIEMLFAKLENKISNARAANVSSPEKFNALMETFKMIFEDKMFLLE